MDGLIGTVSMPTEERSGRTQGRGRGEQKGSFTVEMENPYRGDENEHANVAPPPLDWPLQPLIQSEE